MGRVAEVPCLGHQLAHHPGLGESRGPGHVEQKHPGSLQLAGSMQKPTTMVEMMKARYSTMVFGVESGMSKAG